MSRHPATKWAQRSDKVFITIELPDAKDVKLTLQPDGHFHFNAVTGADNVPYELDFELYDQVNVDESKAAIGLRNVCYLVKKAENKWWSRLIKQEGKAPVYLKVDWDKWIDEDDENEKKADGAMDAGFDKDFGGMDFSKLGMGGGAGGGPDDFEDDAGDDEMEEEETEEATPAAKEPEVSAAAKEPEASPAAN